MYVCACVPFCLVQFAHPKHGQYYDGFLYEDELLLQASSLAGSSSAALAGGVFGGMLAGAAVVVITTLLLTKNRSLLLHAVGYYESSASALGACSSLGLGDMQDSSSSGLTGGAGQPATS